MITALFYKIKLQIIRPDFERKNNCNSDLYGILNKKGEQYCPPFICIHL